MTEIVTLKDLRNELEKLFVGKEYIPYDNLSKTLKRRRTIRETLKRVHKRSRSTDVNDVKLAMISIINEVEPDSKSIFKFYRDIYKNYERVLVGSEDEIYFWVEVIYEADENEKGMNRVKYITITDEDKLLKDMYLK